jgi:F-type H+-transporting ATPase subunit epsilon
MARNMADKVQFELVSPERLLASDEVDMIVLPGEEGEFGVLPLHAPVLSLLRPGVIATYQGSRVEKRIFVAGGFAEVNERGCIVLAETAEPLEELDRGQAEQMLRDARDDLADTREPSEPERQRLERAIRVAEARVEAVQGSPGA